jgi:hypothetical protein
MGWVLILLAGVYAGHAPAMETFGTQEACMRAQMWVLQQTRNTTRAVCLPRGDDPPEASPTSFPGPIRRGRA